MPKKLTTKDFIEKSKNKFPNKFLYDKTVYKGMLETTIIECKKHGNFEVKPKFHLDSKKGCCKKCQYENNSEKSKKRNKESFFKECRRIHNNKYDYSESSFQGVSKSINIICPEHGEFIQNGYHHKIGHGCPKCSKNNILNSDEFKIRANLTHDNFYNYDLVDCINGCNDKIKITCPDHGTFKQAASKHLSGQGCPKCGSIKCSESRRLSDQEFINKANEIHNNRYDYSLVSYETSHKKVKIICRDCKKPFHQRPNCHLSGSGCPNCNSSTGELEIKDFLIAQKIKFIPQKTFDTCRNINKLPFDFFLPNYNLLIEYQGIQHFEPIEFFGGERTFEVQVRRDNIKKNWAKRSKYELKYITYKDKTIETLEGFLNKVK